MPSLQVAVYHPVHVKVVVVLAKWVDESLGNLKSGVQIKTVYRVITK
jgi:hypothetical protein